MLTYSKILFIVLFGLISLQGLTGSATNYEDNRGAVDDIINGILNAAMKVLDGLLEGFSKLADRVHLAIQNVVEHLAARLQQIVNSGSKVIAELASKLGAKVAEAMKLGLIDAQCAAAVTSEVSEMVLNATSNLALCPQNVVPVVNEIVAELKSLMSSFSNLIADGPKEFNACVPKHPTLADIGVIGECVGHALKKIVTDAAKLMGQVEHAITESVWVSEESAAQVAACAFAATEEASKEGETIMKHLSQCVADHSTTPTGGESTTSSTPATS